MTKSIWTVNGATRGPDAHRGAVVNTFLYLTTATSEAEAIGLCMKWLEAGDLAGQQILKIVAADCTFSVRAYLAMIDAERGSGE